MAVISQLYTYPLKSGKARESPSIMLGPGGLENDRCLAVVGPNDRIITGRQFPAMVRVEVDVSGSRIFLSAPDMEPISGMLPDVHPPPVNVRLFKQNVRGVRISEKFDEWISRYLGEGSQIVYIGDHPISVKGFPAVEMGYADDSPVHLVSRRSLYELNKLLPSKVTELHFRPNIVVEGTLPFEEDEWKQVKIGSVPFKVNKLCERCIFTTVNPDTGEKDGDMEPMLTLSRFRKERGEPVSFGIDLVPLASGTLNVGDTLGSVLR